MSRIPERYELVIILLVGALVGFLAGGGGHLCGLGQRFHHHGDKGEMQHRMLDRFSSKLNLTPDQRTQVAAILETKHQKMEALRAEIKPKFDALRASTSAEIRAVLTPDQQPKFDAMQAEWAKRKEQEEQEEHEHRHHGE